jgi:hypothetical protein
VDELTFVTALIKPYVETRPIGVVWNVAAGEALRVSATIDAKGADIAMKSFASERDAPDERSVSLIGKAHRRQVRPSRSLQPLWKPSTGWSRVDDGPSWSLPPLSEAPLGGEGEFLGVRATPAGLPAYKRAWQQPALF